jgi:hypothetical protein
VPRAGPGHLLTLVDGDRSGTLPEKGTPESTNAGTPLTPWGARRLIDTDSTNILKNQILPLLKGIQRAIKMASKTAQRPYKDPPKIRTPRGLVRRFNQLVAAFTSDLGAGDLSNADTALIRQAAALTVRAEQTQAALLRGEAADDDALVRLSNAAARLLNLISAKQGKSPLREQTQEELIDELYGKDWKRDQQ